MRGVAVLLVLLRAVVAGSMLVDSTRPEEFVNTLGGTNSRFDFSRGATLPLIARPWGFNHWAPVTDPKEDDDFGFWFHPYDRRLFGIRCTHQPSPWILDYGQFRLFAGVPSPYQTLKDQASAFQPALSTWKPYYFNASLIGYGTAEGAPTLEFTSTSHGAIMKVTFPEYINDIYNSGFQQNRRIQVLMDGGNSGEGRGYDHAEVTFLDDDGAIAIEGYSRANSGGVPLKGNEFYHYFVAAIYTGERGDQSHGLVVNSSSSNEGAFIDFDTLDPTNSVITVRVATSFISREQARLNLRREVELKKSFHDLYIESKDEWRDVLSRVSITAMNEGYHTQQHELLTTFYSSLYRASLFPRQLSEVSAKGETVHWSPYDPSGGTFAGPVSTDSGFWDAFSTVYPLLTLINRPVLGTTLQGWVNAYEEGGWLPKWASPGYRGSMLGTMADIVISDAIVNHVPGFDVQKAFEAVLKDAYEAPGGDISSVGRACLTPYLQEGYIPNGATQSNVECTEVVSRTLSYYQADYAISQAAKELGEEMLHQDLYNRSMQFPSIFEPKTSFFRAKRVEDKAWVEPFDQYAWGGDYMESGPWQYRFSLPYSPGGLAELYQSGGHNLCDMLDEMQTTASTFHIGTFEGLIKEQTEMVELTWGQYAHNDQPVHHVLYLFGAIDTAGYSGSCAARGQHWLRKAQRSFYKPGVDMFAGDEDNGEMGAWFVLSSIGLYALSPGSGKYEFSPPLFDEVVINISDDIHSNSTLQIKALNNSPSNPYIQKVFWNDEIIYKTNSIEYKTIAKGGTLLFEMGSNPSSMY